MDNLPPHTLRDIVRNPSTLPDVRLEAAYALYFVSGESAFTLHEDMKPFLAEAKSRYEAEESGRKADMQRIEREHERKTWLQKLFS